MNRAQKLKVLSILQAARLLLDDPRHWTKGWEARDKSGGGVSPGDYAAACWCGRGALWAVAPDDQWSRSDASAEVEAQLPLGDWDSIPSYNDAPRRTHADILALYDRAIDKLAAEIDR